MKTKYKDKALYITFISDDGKWVLATRDSKKKKGFFKIDSSDIEEKSILTQLLEVKHKN